MREDRSHVTTPIAQTPVRCAIYIRVNVGASWGAESARMQREAAQAFLRNRDGWTCSGTYEDIGHSGATLQRPGLQRLLTAINAGVVDCVIVHTLDRLARMDDAFGKTVVLPRLRDIKVVALYPKPFVAIYTPRRVDHELAAPRNPLLSSRINA